MKFVVLLCGALLSAGSFSSSADELKERQVTSDTAVTYFHSGQFAALDRDAKRYRDKGDRTSSGLWKLTLFYTGLSGIPNSAVTDEAYWQDLERKAQQWISAFPDSPAGHLVYADFLMSHGWMYRGNGWSHQVRQSDWKPFHEYVAKTRQYLNKHKAVAARDPRWYELMIKVATAEGWEIEAFNALVDEATSRHPYFYQIYFAAIHYLTPKWHGSKEEIEKFAQNAVSKTRSVENDAMYARIYWVASQSNYGDSLFTDSDVVWSKMSKSIDEVLKRYPDQWNINNFAYFSCLAGDAKKTSSLMTRMTGRPIMQAWKSMDFHDRCKRWSSASQAPQENKAKTGPLIPI
ncbi:MAG: cytoplasmic protein [Gammaproteobacteria bacterium]